MAKVKFEALEVQVYAKDSRLGVLTVEKAKELLGWEQEEEGKKEFEDDYLFKDLAGKKVRLNYNDTNRPFRMSLARRYMSEVLRKKWHLNGETLIFDRTGKVQDGQHRLVGLVLAEQERTKTKEQKDHWKTVYGWTGPVNVETIVVLGISEKDDVANSIGGGQKRSLGDVIFRTEDFGQLSDRDQQKHSNVLAGAARLAWIRLGGMTVSDAKHFPHSEARDFIEAHPGLVDCVKFIINEDGGGGAEGRKISSLLSLAYASGLLYLMGVAKTDVKKWEVNGTEAIDTSLMNKAQEFWVNFASGAGLGNDSPILALRRVLTSMETGSGGGRDEIVATVINAWNLWIEEESGTAKDIKPKKIKNDAGKMVLAVMPRIGGLDIERLPIESDEGDKDEEDHSEEDDGEAKPAKKAAKKGTKGKKGTKKAAKKAPVKKKGSLEVGEWIWVTPEDGGPEDAYKAKVAEIDGNDLTVEYEGCGLYAATLDQVSVDKPE